MLDKIALKKNFSLLWVSRAIAFLRSFFTVQLMDFFETTYRRFIVIYFYMFIYLL